MLTRLGCRLLRGIMAMSMHFSVDSVGVELLDSHSEWSCSASRIVDSSAGR
jgi:hypothetical protein